MELEKVKCNLCKKDKIKIIYNEKYPEKKETPRKNEKIKTNDSDIYNIKSSYSHEVHDRIVMCKNCRLVYASPRDKETKSKKEYSKVKSPDYLSDKKEKIIDAKRILKIIKSEVNNKGKSKGTNKRILDIGCFAAFFLNEAKKTGFEVYGIEPSKWAADYNKKVLKINNMICGTIDDSKFRDSFFDIIILNEVIEHLHDPDKVISFCSRKLKKTGILLIISPDFGSIQSKLMKEKWWFIEKVHLYWFTPKTIRKLLEKNNFSDIEIKKYYKSFVLSYVIKKLNLFRKNSFFGRIFNSKLLKDRILRLYSGEMIAIARKK